jgi:hypothetical protein
VRVILALLADYANVSREGKLNIMGVFDSIYARSFPVTHPHMQLVIRFEAEAAEAGSTRQIEVQLQAQDGELIFRLPASMTIQRGDPGEVVRADHILAMNNVAFAEPGRYAFRVLVDGTVAASVPLRVETVPSSH